MARASELPALAVRRPTLIVVVNLLIMIAGIAAFFAVEVRELPNVERTVVWVRAFFDGASPETMDAEVTSVIEGAVARVPGLITINAASEENNARVRAEFSSDVSLDVAANDVREAIAGIEDELPDGVKDIFVYKSDVNSSPIMRLALQSDSLDITELTRIARDEVTTALSAIPGVATVELFGDRRKVLRVVVSPLRLARFGLSIQDVADVVKSASLDVPAGSFQSDDHMLLVRADASLWRPEEIEALALADTITVGDVAQVFYGAEEAESETLLNGRRVVGLGVIRQARANTIQISTDVDAVLTKLNQRLEGIAVIKITDDADFIRSSVQEVVISLLLAVAVVIGVIYVFMRTPALTFIPIVTIPIALIGTVAGLWLMGFSVNILTLLALVLATGMIVDDAIVVVENIQRQHAAGLPAGAAAVVGSRQVFFAVLATTATLISVFLPIAFLPGTAGRLFVEFGFVLSLAVAISSFVALSLCPMLASRLPIAAKNSEQKPRLLDRLGVAVSGLYARFLAFTLQARFLVLGLASLLALLALGLYPAIKQELLPNEDRGELFIMMQGPDGVGLEYMDRQARAAENILQPLVLNGEITNILTIVGRWDLNRVYIGAPLSGWKHRQRRQKEITTELRPQLQRIPGATTYIWSQNSLNLRRAGGRIEFALVGAHYADISEAADLFLQAMQDEMPHFRRPRIEYQQTQPQLSVLVDRRRAEDLGVPVDDIATTLRAMIDGIEVTELSVAGSAVPVILESAAGAIDDPGDLRNLFVANTEGQLVPLSAFISLQEEGIAAELDRTAQSRAIEIDTALPEGYAMSQAIRDIEQLAAKILPENIGLRFINEAATFRDTSFDIAVTFAIAILVVLLVLAAQFESVLSALVIILTVPFGLAAAVFALTLTGVTINIYSQIGLIMLVGLMAKNAILVVEFADQLRDRGATVGDAIRNAAITRLRPVTMTMLSTVLGAVPLILGSGAGIEARNAIGWVVFGGLGIATVFTLVLVPVLYSLLAPFAAPRAHAGVKLDRELRHHGDGVYQPAE